MARRVVLILGVPLALFVAVSGGWALTHPRAGFFDTVTQVVATLGLLVVCAIVLAGMCVALPAPLPVRSTAVRGPRAVTAPTLPVLEARPTAVTVTVEDLGWMEITS